jgi:Lrp/AsnC family transcriptional regulator, leucine-responsive regulatory protein
MNDLRRQLDETDWRILTELQKDARLSYVDLGRIVSLSRPAVAERMKRLEGLGVIRGYHAVVDLARIGREIGAFIRIGAQARTSALVEALRERPEVLACDRGSGEDALIIRAVVPSLTALQGLIDYIRQFGPASATVVLSTPHVKPVLTEGFEAGMGFVDGAGI